MTPREARIEMDRIQALPDTDENAVAKWVTYWEVAEAWIAGFRKAA